MSSNSSVITPTIEALKSEFTCIEFDYKISSDSAELALETVTGEQAEDKQVFLEWDSSADWKQKKLTINTPDKDFKVRQQLHVLKK